MMIIPNSKNYLMKGDDKLLKYWNQRYILFSRFDDGILLDEESWWSVTPEQIAIHIAERFSRGKGDSYFVIVDGFCGVGGNLIQFALSSPFARVIGCDINENRILMARHNAKIYGVQHQCEFIVGDFMNIMPSLKSCGVDAVFLSPPWGGMDYTKDKNYSLGSMTPDGAEVVQACRRYLTKNIGFLMPRNVDLGEIKTRLLDKNNTMCEFEQNMVGKKTKTITVYFGDLIDESSETDQDE